MNRFQVFADAYLIKSGRSIAPVRVRGITATEDTLTRQQKLAKPKIVDNYALTQFLYSVNYNNLATNFDEDVK